MSFLFDARDYTLLHQNVFRDDFPGYRPSIVESPNGDGNWDTQKKYAHIAQKYLADDKDKIRAKQLGNLLVQCNDYAVALANKMGVPPEFYPDSRYSTIRVLDYPPDAITHPHTDFNLFTVMLYRDKPNNFRYIGKEPEKSLQDLSPHLHYGEIMEDISQFLPHPVVATEHEVIADKDRQRSIVFFAIPDWDAFLPSGLTVGRWLERRLSTSRKQV